LPSLLPLLRKNGQIDKAGPGDVLAGLTHVLASGQLVEARGENWIVARQDSYEACTVVTLEGTGSNAGRRLKLISPFDRLRIVKRGRLHRRSRPAVLTIARAAIAGARPVDGLWSAANARITLLPYQLEPALAVLGGTTRVLLADAVGLGKTVQAGLILAELRARGLVDRALVLTPAGLRHAWAEELRDRFGFTPAVLDQAALASQSWLAAADVNPWSCHDIIVASIDFVKRPDVLRSVAAVPVDLVIADEAHHLTPGSDRGAAVEILSTQAAWVILVSATPHSGDEAAFAYLQSLGAQNDRLAIFRRTRTDAGMPQQRRSSLLAVTPAPAEATMLDAVDRYTTAMWRAQGMADASVRLVAMTLRRRAASSAAAVLRTLTRRRDLLSHQGEARLSQPSLPWEEMEDGDTDAADQVLATRGLDDVTEELRQLDHLIRLAEAALASPSKLRRILRLRARIPEPVVIFTEYRDTLGALVSALAPTCALVVIHGGLPIDVRREAIERFTRGDADVLVATDAAGEGLNLQHRCRLVINVELPWNPLRLEQRVGRVERVGQKRRVHAVHLFHRDTVEDAVLARLERRRFRAAVALDHAGEAWISEGDIAAMVFDGTPGEPRAVPSLASVHVSHAEREAGRLAAQRVWGLSAIVGRRPVWTAPRHGEPAPRLVYLATTRHVGSTGLTIEDSLDATIVELVRTPLDRAEWRRLVQALERFTFRSSGRWQFDRARVEHIESALRPFRAAVLARLGAIRLTLARSRRRQWQASLFDRRIERDEERRVETLNTIEAHLARKMELITQLTPVGELVRRCFIAAWTLRDRS
jgi:superfamily II DNA or RNA helicase